ncbi:major capsid protein [Thiomicrorhabdus sp.]|uniref:major capsid protein n=1 Tax=Thiomicrorhabdus sp. TaxID=2039724 RepID=UPI0029C8A84B|nr:major capsid protein [Thiomicrorhabdus sp.]
MDIGIFSDDKFSVESLTVAINEAPALPTRLTRLGLFASEGILTTSFVIEKNTDTLELIPNQSRSAAPVGTGGGARSIRSFATTHLPTQDVITADDIQNLRSFGFASEVETMEAFVAKRLAKMRRRIDATIEYQRIGAIKGLILDSDGTTVISNLFTDFGITRNTATLSLASDTADLRGEIFTATDKALDALGSEPNQGFRCICGKGFFRALINHPKAQKAYELYESGAKLRDDVRDGFEFAGVIFEEYRGAIGGTPFIADGEAFLFPQAVEGMFITRNAPANWMETVNTIGLDMYAKQWFQQDGRGVTVEAQANPLSICTRPNAVIKLTVTA